LADDDYELIPKQELESLKREIEKLKKNPLGTVPEGDSLLGEIKELNSNMKKLMELFTNTEADLAREYAENNPAESLKAVKQQNEQIAQGILALADMIKQMRDDASTRTNAPPRFDVQNPPVLTDQYGFPVPGNAGLPDFNSPMGLPPQGQVQINPAPIAERKKGFFFKK
jgi:hypothetical protein